MSDACQSSPVGILLDLAEQLRQRIDEAARSVHLTGPQAQLLMQLDHPSRMSDLAEEKACDPSSITSLVQRLERDGHVAREIDPDDGRARRIRITPKGRRTRQRFMEHVGDGSAVVQRLSDHDRLVLVSLLAPSDVPA